MRGQRNHWVWSGPLLAFLGALTYFLVFARVPVLRDFPWINLPLVWCAIVLSVLGVRKARAVGRGKVLAVAGLAVSVLLGALFHGYVFWLSYQLPAAATAVAVRAPAPDFTLSDQSGRSVTLSDYRGQKVLLVFYRGHW